MSETYVLITGAWHGGWGWRAVAQSLRANGHRVLAPKLPGLADGDDPTHHSLADVVDNVAGLIERHDLSDVVLVGRCRPAPRRVRLGALRRAPGRRARARPGKPRGPVYAAPGTHASAGAGIEKPRPVIVTPRRAAPTNRGPRPRAATPASWAWRSRLHDSATGLAVAPVAPPTSMASRTPWPVLSADEIPLDVAA
jgi:hypothetical protein